MATSRILTPTITNVRLFSVTSARPDIHVPKYYDKKKAEYLDNMLNKYLKDQYKAKKIAAQPKRPEEYYEKDSGNKLYNGAMTVFSGLNSLAGVGKSLFNKLSGVAANVKNQIPKK